MHLLFINMYILLYNFYFLNFIFIKNIHYGLQHIRKTTSNVAWLVCFYIGEMENLRNLNLQIKKLSISGVNLGRYFCNPH